MLDQDLATLIRPPFDVVANIPYHITSPILHRVLALEQPPERVVLMVQREVAERVAAAPGKMSYLSVFAQYHAAVRVAADRPARGVRARAGRSSRPCCCSSHARSDRFRARRKTSSGGSCRRGSASAARCSTTCSRASCPLPASRVAAALEAAGIASDRRPQTVSVEEWLRLLLAIRPLPGRP